MCNLQAFFSLILLPWSKSLRHPYKKTLAPTKKYPIILFFFVRRLNLQLSHSQKKNPRSILRFPLSVLLLTRYSSTPIITVSPPFFYYFEQIPPRIVLLSFHAHKHDRMCFRNRQGPLLTKAQTSFAPFCKDTIKIKKKIRVVCHHSFISFRLGTYLCCLRYRATWWIIVMYFGVDNS